MDVQTGNCLTKDGQEDLTELPPVTPAEKPSTVIADELSLSLFGTPAVSLHCAGNVVPRPLTPRLPLEYVADGDNAPFCCLVQCSTQVSDFEWHQGE
ncbi:hypothetical protein IRJ41_008444 [Triplophysa rosa]|uniref:Uncharacterized protein n=1 Tax=Triplophysa rosa TaxID=992332 RepID=A0A9W7T2B3_TRIRA|nr:hypothetical protein IRJ41_008444 [Triplophysa rosa]